MIWILTASLLAGAVPQQKSSQDLAKQWSSESVDQRNDATKEFLDRWGDWKDADLEYLDRISRSLDAEISTRAREVAWRVRFRQKFGNSILEKLGPIDQRIANGQSHECLEDLLKAGELWRSLKLDRSQLRDLAGLMADHGITLPVEELKKSVLQSRISGSCGPLIVPLLTSENPEIRQASAYWLQELDRKEYAPRVRALLRDNAVQVRVAAIEALSAFGDKESAPSLAVLLDDPEPAISHAALSGLLKLGAREHADKIIRKLGSLSESDSPHVILGLARSGVIEALPLLLPLLRDKEKHVRRLADEAFLLMKPKDQARHLLGLIRTQPDEIKSEAASLLVSLGAREVLPELAELLRDPNHEVRLAALQAIGGFGAEEYVKEVTAAINDADDWNQLIAIETLAKIGNRETAKGLAALLHDNKKQVRGRACRAVADLGAQAYGTDVITLISDPDADVAYAACESMASLGGPNAIEVFTRRIDSKRDVDQALAAWGLGRLGARSQSGKIAELLKVKNDYLRIAALDALATLDARETVDAVHPFINEKDSMLRAHAVRALGMLDPERCVRDMAPLLKGTERFNQKWAVLALLEMRRPGHLREIITVLEAAEVGYRHEIAFDLLPLAEIPMAADERRLLVRWLETLEEDRISTVREYAGIALLRLGEKSSAYEKMLVDSADPSRRTWTRTILSAVAGLREQDNRTKLSRIFALEAPIESLEDLRKLLADKFGLKLESPARAIFRGRFDTGTRVTCNRMLERLTTFAGVNSLHDEPRLEIVPDGDRLRLLSLTEAAMHWKNRLAR